MFTISLLEKFYLKIKKNFGKYSQKANPNNIAQYQNQYQLNHGKLESEVPLNTGQSG